MGRRKSYPEGAGIQAGAVEAAGKEVVALSSIEVSLYEAQGQRWGDLTEAENAFKMSMEFHEHSLLLNAIAAWQIAEYELYKPRFKTLNSYLVLSKERLGVSRAYFFERVRIADALIRFRDQLHSAGFRENRDASKLRLFYQAIEAHGEDAAIDQLPQLSFRDYKRWIRDGVSLEDLRDEDEDGTIEIDDSGIRYNGELVVSRRVVQKIYLAGETPWIVGVQSDAEKRAVSRYLNKMRKEKTPPE